MLLWDGFEDAGPGLTPGRVHELLDGRRVDRIRYGLLLVDHGPADRRRR
jgi:hypothetical protein